MKKEFNKKVLEAFDLEGFLNGKFCVFCATDELEKNFLRFLEDNTDLRWKSGQKPTDFTYVEHVVYYGRDSLGGRYLTYGSFSSASMAGYEIINWNSNFVLIDENIKKEEKGEDIDMNKQQIENRIKELRNELEGLNKQLEDYVFPKKGDTYYSYSNYYGGKDGALMVNEYRFVNDLVDNRLVKSGLFFKTEEEAENQGFASILRQRMLKFAEENNEKELDWDNKAQAKYRIVFYEGNLDLDYMYTNKEPFQVYFSSKKIAEKALEEFRDDLLQLYRFNV